MHFPSLPIILAICDHVTAAPPPISIVPNVLGVDAPALPMSSYDTPKYCRPLTLAEAVMGDNATVTTIRDHVAEIKRKMPELQFPQSRSPRDLQSELGSESETDFGSELDLEAELDKFEKRQSTCTNPRVRVDWDTFSTADRQNFVDSIKCLLRARPSGRFSGSQNRYEDLVVLHQQSTPTVHGNARFLLWHRYFLWTFEDVLRRECGFRRAIPFFNEAPYAGQFQSSSIFSAQWFGNLLARGNCVTDGQFANLANNIGPGTSNRRHCLSRNGDESKTANTKQSITDACNARTTFADMAACTEGGAHAWGHNGIGAVMQDVYGSPSDPVFWLHHAYIDNNFRKWQEVDARRRMTSVGGNDWDGRAVTLDSALSMGGIRPTRSVRDVLDTRGVLCYRYAS
jgi:tyrosinase